MMLSIDARASHPSHRVVDFIELAGAISRSSPKMHRCRESREIGIGTPTLAYPHVQRWGLATQRGSFCATVR